MSDERQQAASNFRRIALALWGWVMACGTRFCGASGVERIGGSLATAFDAAASRNLGASETAFRNYKEAKYVYDRQVDVHGHWIGLAMLLIVVGIAFDRVRFAERQKLVLASALLAGAAIFPFGVLLQIFDHGAIRGGSPFSDRYW